MQKGKTFLGIVIPLSKSNVQNASAGLSAIPLASVRMAMAAVGVLPILIMYPFVQKYFVKGITLGGVKG